ncbi:hypothetical protein ACFOWE_32435 [Planomonospora corallina]|uniref:Uncharacterized protein n=1 Tax=Planomonospora corallina TaxID=1806052 RepID=A0ABV8IJ51_9ACTN
MLGHAPGTVNAGELWAAEHPVHGGEQVVLLSGEVCNRQAGAVSAAPVRTLVDSHGYSVPLSGGGYAAIDSMRTPAREDLIEQVGHPHEMDVMQIVVLAVISDLDTDRPLSHVPDRAIHRNGRCGSTDPTDLQEGAPAA